YRKVLCKLPAYLIWDDHDITDGWGSREDSYKSPDSDEFSDKWRGLFESAQTCFKHFQAVRNLRLDGTPGFDTCFRLGDIAFVLADLRSNRKKRKGKIWDNRQFEAVKKWISEQEKLETIFFLSPVVFSHEDPNLVERTYPTWGRSFEYFRKLDS